MALRFCRPLHCRCRWASNLTLSEARPQVSEAEARKSGPGTLAGIGNETQHADPMNQRPHHTSDVHRVAVYEFPRPLAVPDGFLENSKRPIGYLAPLRIEVSRLAPKPEHDFEMRPMFRSKKHVSNA